jgi:hypothetical protein
LNAEFICVNCDQSLQPGIDQTLEGAQKLDSFEDVKHADEPTGGNAAPAAREQLFPKNVAIHDIPRTQGDVRPDPKSDLPYTILLRDQKNVERHLDSCSAA